MTDYTIRGDEEVYNAGGEVEAENLLPPLRVQASSLEEALETGRKELQRKICASRLMEPCSKMYVARVDLIFDKKGIEIFYMSEKIKKQHEERKNDKFDLQAAIRDGCAIDESGAGTCGG